MAFLDKVEQIIESTDDSSYKFIVNVIENYPNLPIYITKRLLEKTIQTEKLEVETIMGLQHACFDDGTVKSLAKVLASVQHQSDNYYLKVFERIEPFYLVLNKHILKGFLSDEELSFLTFTMIGTEKEIWLEYKNILNQLGEDTYYDQNLFVRGQRLARVIVNNGWVTEQDLGLILEENWLDDYFSYEGIFAIYMIEQMGIVNFIPLLSQLLLRVDEEVVITVVSETLISFQSNAVIHAVLALEVVNPTVIEIISGTKTRLAFETLRDMYNTVQDMDMLLLVLEGLVNSLYVDARYDVERFVRENGRSSLLYLEELVDGFFKATEQFEQLMYIAEEKEDYS